MAEITYAFFYYKELAYFFLTFLLVFAVVLGTLLKSKHLSEDININSVIAFSIALMFAVSGAVKLIVALIPFIALLLLAYLGIFIVLMFLGYDWKELLKSKTVVYAILIGTILFVVLAAASIYKTEIDETKERLLLLNETGEGLNLTGNPLMDLSIKYSAKCEGAGLYGQPMSKLGFGCILVHPRILGAYIVLFLMGITTFAIVMRTRMAEGK